MSRKLPSAYAELLRGLIGLNLVRVRRQFRAEEHASLPGDVADQQADGATELAFDHDAIVHLTPHTEMMSVLVGAGEIPINATLLLRDVSRNEFWCGRVGKKVSDILIWKMSFEQRGSQPKLGCSEFGIEFRLEGGEGFFIKYVSDSDHVDSLIVSANLDEMGGHCSSIA